MPVHNYPPCPECGEKLIRKPAGCCPACGAEVTAFVARERQRETRIEKVVAIVGTALMLGVLVLGGGLGVVEGLLAYAIGGAAVWTLARGTFYGRDDPA